MAVTVGSKGREMEQIPKSRLSSDCRLQLACVKVESLVIADQHAAVNTFLALYTPPVTPWELASTLSRWATRKGGSRPRSGQRLG